MDSKEALAQKVFECTNREYSAFIEDMKKHDPDYLVDHAYEIVIMSDLRMIFEKDELSLPALQDLDKLERPLTSIYDEWLKNNCGYMEQLRKAVGCFTDKRLRETAQRYYADPAIPRYGKGFSEAQECDEVHLYHASRRRDVECIRYYDEHIHDAHDSHSMKAFTQQWAELFGRDRCKFVLGYTVQGAEWDARYAPQAKRDSHQYDYSQNNGFDYFREYNTNVHPCLVDSSYRILMDLERGKTKSDKER